VYRPSAPQVSSLPRAAVVAAPDTATVLSRYVFAVSSQPVRAKPSNMALLKELGFPNPVPHDLNAPVNPHEVGALVRRAATDFAVRTFVEDALVDGRAQAHIYCLYGSTREEHLIMKHNDFLRAAGASLVLVPHICGPQLVPDDLNRRENSILPEPRDTCGNYGLLVNVYATQDGHALTPEWIAQWGFRSVCSVHHQFPGAFDSIGASNPAVYRVDNGVVTYYADADSDPYVHPIPIWTLGAGATGAIAWSIKAQWRAEGQVYALVTRFAASSMAPYAPPGRQSPVVSVPIPSAHWLTTLALQWCPARFSSLIPDTWFMVPRPFLERHVRRIRSLAVTRGSTTYGLQAIGVQVARELENDAGFQELARRFPDLFVNYQQDLTWAMWLEAVLDKETKSVMYGRLFGERIWNSTDSFTKMSRPPVEPPKWSSPNGLYVLAALLGAALLTRKWFHASMRGDLLETASTYLVHIRQGRLSMPALPLQIFNTVKSFINSALQTSPAQLQGEVVQAVDYTLSVARKLFSVPWNVAAARVAVSLVTAFRQYSDPNNALGHMCGVAGEEWIKSRPKLKWLFPIAEYIITVAANPTPEFAILRMFPMAMHYTTLYWDYGFQYRFAVHWLWNVCLGGAGLRGNLTAPILAKLSSLQNIGYGFCVAGVIASNFGMANDTYHQYEKAVRVAAAVGGPVPSPPATDAVGILPHTTEYWRQDAYAEVVPPVVEPDPYAVYTDTCESLPNPSSHATFTVAPTNVPLIQYGQTSSTCKAMFQGRFMKKPKNLVLLADKVGAMVDGLERDAAVKRLVAHVRAWALVDSCITQPDVEPVYPGAATPTTPWSQLPRCSNASYGQRNHELEVALLDAALVEPLKGAYQTSLITCPFTLSKKQYMQHMLPAKRHVYLAGLKALEHDPAKDVPSKPVPFFTMPKCDEAQPLKLGHRYGICVHEDGDKLPMPRPICPIAPRVQAYLGRDTYRIQKWFTECTALVDTGFSWRMTPLARWTGARRHVDEEIDFGENIPVYLHYAGVSTPQMLGNVANWFFMQQDLILIQVVGDDSLVWIKVRGRVITLESDMSQCDQSLREAAMSFQFKIYSMLGMPESMIYWYDMLNRAPRLWRSRKLGMEGGELSYRSSPCRATGSGDTSLGNSVVNGFVWFGIVQRVITRAMVDAHDVGVIASACEQFAADLGLCFKIKAYTALADELGENTTALGTFLRGFYCPTTTELYIGSDFTWTPLPSRFLKLGKTLNNPRVTMKLHPRENLSLSEAGIRFMAGQARGLLTVPLPPFLREALSQMAAPDTPRLLWSWHMPHQSHLDHSHLRPDVYLRYCVERYGGTGDDWNDFWELFKRWGAGKRFVHPLWLAMAHVDYA